MPIAMRTSWLATMARAWNRTGAFVGSHRAEQALEELPTGLAGRVAHELAAHRVVRDRVAAVEGDVGLVGPELLAVVRHVAAPVRVDRRERREAEQPAADEVVDLAVAEQQPVRGLVHQRRELRVGAAHEEERGDPDEPVAERQLSKCTATTTIAIVCAYSATTASALRAFGIRRSCSRNSGVGRPAAVMRSVGWTVSSRSGSGIIVVATPSYYTLATDDARK